MGEIIGFEDLLRIKGVVEILVYLHEKPEGAQKVDLRDDLNLFSATQIKAHKFLYNAKLITSKPNQGRHLFTLTEKGKFLAERLCSMKNRFELPDN